MKRNEQSYRERGRLNKEYLVQKQNVQLLVKEAITSFEKKITTELRKSKNRSKTLWENIDRLRKKERMSGDDIHLFGEDGIQLNQEQAKEELVRYWTRIPTA